jgi:hypothetical protein
MTDARQETEPTHAAEPSAAEKPVRGAPTEAQRQGAIRAAVNQARDINEALSKRSASPEQKPTRAVFEQATEKLAENISDAYLMAVEGDADCEALCAQRLQVAQTLYGANLERWLGKNCPQVNWTRAQEILREGRATKAHLVSVDVRVTTEKVDPGPPPQFIDEYGRPALELSNLASQINNAHAAAKAAMGTAFQRAVRCGELLSEAKKRVPHGEWLPFLRGRCREISERSAQDYIRLYTRRDEITKSAGSADLSISDALALISKPKPETTSRKAAAPATAEKIAPPAVVTTEAAPVVLDLKAETGASVVDAAGDEAITGTEPAIENAEAIDDVLHGSPSWAPKYDANDELIKTPENYCRAFEEFVRQAKGAAGCVREMFDVRGWVNLPCVTHAMKVAAQWQDLANELGNMMAGHAGEQPAGDQLDLIVFVNAATERVLQDASPRSASPQSAGDSRASDPVSHSPSGAAAETHVDPVTTPHAGIAGAIGLEAELKEIVTHIFDLKKESGGGVTSFSRDWDARISREIAVELGKAWRLMLAQIVDRDHNAGIRARRKRWKAFLREVYIDRESALWVAHNTGERIVLPG